MTYVLVYENNSYVLSLFREVVECLLNDFVLGFVVNYQVVLLSVRPLCDVLGQTSVSN